MPKVIARDPSWLVGSGAPGLNLFQPSNDASSHRRSPSPESFEGPLRHIAHRGTEAFVAVGNELRWNDLARLRDAEGSGHETPPHRVLKTPVHREITQLTVSPSGDYLAILTSHTCHVCILPAASHLRSQDLSPLRLKSFQLGPTAHVLEQSPLVSAIWHPLPPSGNALVTITHDACVRLWELDSSNRSAFDEPALAIDLKKLGNATSLQADLSASKYGTNRGFSPDDVEMQVAAACFGGQGRDDEHGWASMTLWVAMTEGDVYALCPFLPAKWFAPASLLPTLSTSVTERARALRGEDGGEGSERERRIVDEQTRWLRDIDAQDPMVLEHPLAEFDSVEVFSRPECLSAIPKLQGPFSISPEPDFGEITDIYVVGPKIDDEALYDDENLDLRIEEGLSVSIICLATSTNEVHVCLDLDGVEAEWLPRKRSRAYNLDDVVDEKELLLFETVDLAKSDAEDDGWPTFTASPIDRYELFVTFPSGVCGISFRQWIGLIEDELAAPTNSGAELRLDVVLKSSSTIVDQPIKITSDDAENKMNAAISILDPSIGFLLLTAVNNTPHASILDAQSPQSSNPYLPDDAAAPAQALLTAPEPRAPYRPPQIFDQPSNLPQLLKIAHDRNLLGIDVKRQQVRFSPATLQLLTEAHRVMSNETHRLGLAAADLFRRCERMRSELREQIRRVAEIAERVENVAGDHDDEDEDEGEEGGEEEGRERENDAAQQGLIARAKLERRVRRSKEKSSLLNTRVDALRRRMLLLGGRELNVKEVRFAEEVQRLQSSIFPDEADAQLGKSAGDDDDEEEAEARSERASQVASLTSRFQAVNALRERLAGDVEAVQQQQQQQQNKQGDAAQAGLAESGFGRSSTMGSSVGGAFRRQKLAQVMALLERESALIEAVGERLGRLRV